MASSVRPPALRCVLLFVLAIAVAGMHSLIVGEPAHGSMAPAPAMATEVSIGPSCCLDEHDLAAEQPGRSSSDPHSVQHLCLAVLVAAFVLIVAWLLCRRGHNLFAHRGPSSSVARAGRDPPFALRSRDVLSSLCVLLQ